LGRWKLFHEDTLLPPTLTDREWSITYPDGQEYRVVDLIELRSLLVYRETVCWPVPFEPPVWRRPHVEVPDALG
jgi:hypothetical protein